MGLKTRFDSELHNITLAYGNAVIKSMTTELLRLKKKASGDLIKSLEVEILQADGKSVIRLSALEYLERVEKGTPAGGEMPSYKAISRWASFKGISQYAVNPIRRKIARDGIKPSGDITKNSIRQTDKRYKKTFEKQLQKMVGVVVVNDIFGQTTTFGKIIPKNLRQ